MVDFEIESMFSRKINKTSTRSLIAVDFASIFRRNTRRLEIDRDRVYRRSSPVINWGSVIKMETYKTFATLNEKFFGSKVQTF